MRKKEEPYKGYWVLQNSMVKNDETIEDNISNVVCDTLGIKSLYIEQSHVYSSIDRNKPKKNKRHERHEQERDDFLDWDDA